MSVPDYKINYKSDFVLNINGDAGWAIPFCIKFWTGMPSQAYFVGFDGVKYVNCRVGDTPTQLLVMFDDHHLPIGPLKMQIAYHTTIEEFPGSVFDEVTNARDVIVTIDGTDYQVMLDFTGEDAPELEFNLPAYANEAERIQNELQRQQNEADRIAAELQREQATAAAVQGAENVNAQLSGTTLTVTNRQGVSTSVNTKGEQGEQGPVGPEGPQGEQGVSIVSFRQVYASETATYYVITFSDGHEQSVAIPKGAKGDTGATGPQGPQGPQGDTGVSITGFVETGETETATLYNITFSNGTTQQVAIPKGAKGDQGPVGPVGPQGPMGDVAVITPEQQAAFTMYSEPGQNTNGPMTQKAVTDFVNDKTVVKINHTELNKVLKCDGTYIGNTGIANGWQYAKYPVSEGDVVVVTGTGGGSGRLWAIARSDGYILSRSGANASENGKVLVMPANAGWIVLNSTTATAEWYYAKAGSTWADAILGKIAKYTSFDNSQSIFYSDDVQGALDEIDAGGEKIDFIAESGSSIPYWVSNDNKWHAKSNSYPYYSRIIPIDNNRKYRITAKDSERVYFTLLSSDVPDTSAAKATEWGNPVFISPGESLIVNSGIYSYLCCRYGASGTTSDYPKTVEKLYTFTERNEAIDSVIYSNVNYTIAERNKYINISCVIV